MRALLVNPWIYDFAAYDLWSKPLGLLTIGSYLKKAGCSVSLIDCLDRFHPLLEGITPSYSFFESGAYFSEEIEKPYIFKNIPRRFKRYGMPVDVFKKLLAGEKEPDIILLTSGMTYWYPAINDTINILKVFFPKTPVLLGGNYVNLCFDHAKKTSKADFIYKGNDIKEILILISTITQKPLKISPEGDKEHTFPAYELYPKLRYITLKTSRGCPFKCTYCGWHLLESTFEQDKPKLLAGQIEYFYKEHNIKNFSFYDDALLYNAKQHIIPIFKILLKKKINVNFHTPNGLHNKFITREIATLLKKSNFIRPRLALETSSVKRQIKTGAKTTNKAFLEAIKYLKNAGYNARDIAVYILIGLPGQSLKEVRESIEFAAGQNVRISLEEYSPIPGTADYKRTALLPNADPLYHNNCAYSVYRKGTAEKIQALKDLIHKKNREK